MGISFSGISQLFVGGARPPHLAAIAPLSVIADIYRAPGYPGGIFNTGFAQTWLAERQHDSQPAPEGGQAYAAKREAYVQDGWLRASHRRLDGKTSTILAPRPTHLERDARLLPENAFTKVRVELFSVAHVFRKGSRIRLSIEAPGGDRTRWDFDTPATHGGLVNEIARTPAMPSRVVLAVVPGIEAPPSLPPCPGLRGQPCRTYVPAANGG